MNLTPGKQGSSNWLVGGSVTAAAALVVVVLSLGVPSANGCGGAPEASSSDGDQSDAAAMAQVEENERWNSAGDPKIFSSTLNFKLDAMPAKGEAKVIPWTGSYWPTYQDNINYRWAGPNTDSPAKKYEKAFKLSGVEDAVSTEHGIDSVTWAKSCTADSQCKGDEGEACAKRAGKTTGRCIPTWFGICHAWTPAAILWPEPKHAVVKNGVKFEVADLKALASLVHNNTVTKFVGLRCDADDRADPKNFDKYGRPLNEECRDSNAGTLHVIIGNYLGINKKAFAEDRTRDSQVWNQPVRGYRVLEKREVTAQEANRLIGVTPEAGTIVNKTGSLAAKAFTQVASFDVPAGASYKITMDGSGDPDLYVKLGAAPSATSYGCRPYKKGPKEECAGVMPAGQTKIFVAVRGNEAAATSTFNLAVNTGMQVPALYQFNKDAKKLVFLKVEMDYISEASAETDGYLTPSIDDYTQTDHYQYVLELDAAGKIIGGEWVGESRYTHPDFLWLPKSSSVTTVGGGKISYAEVKKLMAASIK